MARRGYVSVRELAIFAVMLAVLAAVVVGVSVYRGEAAAARRGRIISLSPALTDLLFQIGAGNQVKGVSEYTRLPGGVKLPAVGDAMRIDREMILRLQPQVIVVQQEPKGVLEQLHKDDNIRVEQITVETLGDLRGALRRLDEIAHTGRSSAVIRRIDGELDAVRRAVAGRPRPSVLLALNRDPAMAAGRSTFLDELLEVAGGRNAVALARYPILNDEQIFERQPDVIIDLTPVAEGGSGAVQAARKDSWANLRVPAVGSGRIYVLSDPLLTIPGGHVGRTARELARVLHPDAFDDSPATRPAAPVPDR